MTAYVARPLIALGRRLRRMIGAAIQWFLDAHESHARAKWRGLENPDEIARRKGVP